MANLSAKEIRKYDYRPEVFIKKIKEKSPFEITGGKKVTLIAPKNYEKILRSGTAVQLNELRFASTSGTAYKLSDFVKTPEFGGKGEGASTAKEDAALMSLRDQIKSAKKKEGSATINIRVGTTTYEVADAASTPGTPKSDFHLLDANGKEIVWISHKDGSTERDFQQWGGMSESKEPKIYSHPESQQFIKDMLKLYPKGLPNATTVARKIKNFQLKNMAVYGNEFGGEYSRQNVTLMLQGSVKLSKNGNVYKITATHTHDNGETMKGGYEPVFMAIYKGDRSDFGIKGTRVVIAPYGCRKIKGMV
jgi:hypothetical protein